MARAESDGGICRAPHLVCQNWSWLGTEEHEADRWVAATAVWLQVPLVAHDGIFANVKDIELLTKING